jgi:AcrR family transcriptional regulator
MSSDAPTPPTLSRTAARTLARAQKKAERPARAQLTPKDWVDAATELLVRKSVDAVNVDALAKTLGVTRGSFYWHFADREALLTEMLERWRDDATQQVIDRFEREGVTPRELISELLSLPFHGQSASRASAIELAIRAWARRDDLARHAVDSVDAQRLSYIAQCFSALNFDLAEARARAFLLYSYELAESLIASHGATGAREQRREQVERLLLQVDSGKPQGPQG